MGLKAKAWSPYAVGVGLGVLSWFAFATADRGLGITTAFEHSAALLGGLLGFDGAISPYVAKEKPKISWEWMLVVGVFLGAWLSSTLSGDRTRKAVPSLWRERFGDSRRKRYLASFAGGAVMMLGARIAGGCTSGHGITGTLQLAVSSWLFIIAAFAVAMLTAFTLYGRKGRDIARPGHV